MKQIHWDVNNPETTEYTTIVDVNIMELSDLKLLPERDPLGNKGTFGHVLVVAGSHGMCGAAYFAAAAALKTGAGMVKIQTVEENRIPLQILLPEAMIACRGTEEEYRNSVQWCDVLVMGPGLGISEESEERAAFFLQAAAEEKKPVILDADGLNLLASHQDWRAQLGDHVILTPHPGELSRLTGKSISELKGRIYKSAAQLALETGTVCVAKDAATVTAGSGKMFLNLSGNAAMATAGSGDVLSGILAGVCCRFLHCKEPDAVTRAALGVYIHGLAGDLAAAEASGRSLPEGYAGATKAVSADAPWKPLVLWNPGSQGGVLAGDIIRNIPGALQMQ